MRLFYFSLVTVFSTWILLLIGGIVNPMGASLACPDWYFIPTCNGQLLPEMKGGVLYEHGHRLWASLVGLLTIALAVAIWFLRNSDKSLRILSIFGVLLVAFQGILGGVTVLLGLNVFISTFHLVTAMSFFCLLIYISYCLYPKAIVGFLGEGKRGIVGIAAVLALVQIMLGGLVRHVGAGLACGDDWLSCGSQFWPAWSLGQLHMLHRIMGYCLAAMVFFVCLIGAREAKRCGFVFAQKVVWLPIILVCVQIGLGLATVATVRSVFFVSLHTAFGALLLASLFTLYLSLKSRAAKVEYSFPSRVTPSHIQNRWVAH
jgi:heme A synthase